MNALQRYRHNYYKIHKEKWIRYREQLNDDPIKKQEYLKRCRDWKRNNPEKIKSYYKTHKDNILKIRNHYNQTLKGNALSITAHRLHNPINHLKQRNALVIENCVICNSSKNIEMHHPNPELSLHVYFLCHRHHMDQHHDRSI